MPPPSHEATVGLLKLNVCINHQYNLLDHVGVVAKTGGKSLKKNSHQLEAIWIIGGKMKI